MKAKRPFSVESKHKYNPDEEGYGSPFDWKWAFRERMGFDEAKRVVADDSPYAILGIKEGATWEEVKKAYRTKAMATHPDHNPQLNGDSAPFRKVQGAYEVLERIYSKD